MAPHDQCPGCKGPITFTPDDSDGVTVNFHCANPQCEYGKHPAPIVQATPANAGCWVEGHLGQYAVAEMVSLARHHGYSDWPIIDIADRHLASMGPSISEDISDDEHETLAWSADEVEAWMNENVAPDGYYFAWEDGEFFLRETVTPGICKDCGDTGDECGDDPDDEHSRHCWWVTRHDDGRDQTT